jgi:predicted nucleic acid-binding protein
MGLILVDTNIVIYSIAGLKKIEPYINEYDFAVSEITIIELLGVKEIDDFTLQKRKEFIDLCPIYTFNTYLREIVIRLKQQYILKIPDAIIAASALFYDIPFLTADKEFKKIKELEAIIFEL